MQHIGDSGGMIAQRLRQTFTGSHCRVPREPGPLLEVPGFRFLEVVPAVALGRDTHGRNVTELRRPADIFGGWSGLRKRLRLVLASQDHQAHVEHQHGQWRPPDPPWPQRTRTNGKRSRPIDRRSEPRKLTLRGVHFFLKNRSDYQKCPIDKFSGAFRAALRGLRHCASRLRTPPPH